MFIDRKCTLAAASIIVVLLATEARAETVDVKYPGPVDLKVFDCRDINRSNFIQRVCYDKTQNYMVINLRGTYYHYCELPPVTLDALIGAPSIGQFYNQNIKGSGSGWTFMIAERIACRATSTPAQGRLLNV